MSWIWRRRREEEEFSKIRRRLLQVKGGFNQRELTELCLDWGANLQRLHWKLFEYFVMRLRKAQRPLGGLQWSHKQSESILWVSNSVSASIFNAHKQAWQQIARRVANRREPLSASFGSSSARLRWVWRRERAGKWGAVYVCAHFSILLAPCRSETSSQLDGQYLHETSLILSKERASNGKRNTANENNEQRMGNTANKWWRSQRWESAR